MNLLREDEDGYWYNSCKEGNKSWKRAFFIENEKTILKTCDLCGKTSTPRKVTCRNDVFFWNFDKKDFSTWADTTLKNVLCVPCWNKIRAIFKREGDALEIKKLVNQLTREVKKWQKSQHQAG